MRGLVVPANTHSALLAAQYDADRGRWSQQRNDYTINPRPAEQPWALQWVETQLNERLRIQNGRPLEHTTIRQRTYRLSPSR